MLMEILGLVPNKDENKEECWPVVHWSLEENHLKCVPFMGRRNLESSDAKVGAGVIVDSHWAARLQWEKVARKASPILEHEPWVMG